MAFLYSLIITLCIPLVLLYFGVRGFKDRTYWQRWKERLGFFEAPPTSGGIVLHAASVGEFNAASPLINMLLKDYPEIPLTVTTLTPTGSQRVMRELAGKVSHVYIPIDSAGAVARFYERLRPRLVIVIETEVWPNLYRAAHRRDIPVVMANARLSDNSVKQYKRLSALIRPVLQPLSWVGAQSEKNAERLVNCGSRAEVTDNTGNLKFDLQVPASLSEQAEALRQRWGSTRPVLVAGSTHEADEAVLIPAFVKLLEKLPEALLILVPRHPERFDKAAQSVRHAGLSVQLFSEDSNCRPQTQCFVIDTMGQLMNYYAAADAVFVGGSMGEQGGHNALEPAALGKAIMIGPNYWNAREIVDELLGCGAALQVVNADEMFSVSHKLLGDGLVRDQMGQAGLHLVESNRGALDLTMKAIQNVLNNKQDLITRRVEGSSDMRKSRD
jgi:3-deoxy-D-manno-octulosonic-acid transferase